MPSTARTPAAGSARPDWPARRHDQDVPRAPDHRDAKDPAWSSATGQVTAAARPAAPVARPQPPAPTDPVEVPAQEAPLDPRSIARASLAAGRNRSLWWTLAGIATAVGVTFVTDAVVGSVVLGLLLLVYAVVRAFGRPPGPAAVSVRSQRLDVAVLLLAAVALIGLASVLPPG